MAARSLKLFVRVEAGGVSSDGECIRPVNEGGAEGDGRGVPDADEQALGRGQDAILRRSVCHGVADDFADLDAAGLVGEEHRIVEGGFGGEAPRGAGGGEGTTGGCSCAGGVC